MTITSAMNIEQLAERMGYDVSADHAERMKAVLLEAGLEGSDTADIDEKNWLGYMAQATSK